MSSMRGLISPSRKTIAKKEENVNLFEMNNDYGDGMDYNDPIKFSNKQLKLRAKHSENGLLYNRQFSPFKINMKHTDFNGLHNLINTDLD